MRKFVGLAITTLALFAGGARAGIPDGALFIYNDAPALFGYVLDAGPNKTIAAGSYQAVKLMAGAHRLKVTGRGFSRIQSLSLSKSNAHDNGIAGGLRWCAVVTADITQLLSPKDCFFRLHPEYAPPN